MEEFIKVIFKMALNMVKDHQFGQVEKNMKEIVRMDNKMEK